jgi:hypothetical protein
MNISQLQVIRTGGELALAAVIVSLAACGGGGGGGTSRPPSVAFSGTAATGKALAQATISIDCAQGSTSVVTDASGNYRATLNAVTPCMIVATSGATMLHSFAFAGGTFNVTPETDLLLSYLAAQLGTNESALAGGFHANVQFQRVMANQSDVSAAQAAVALNLQQTFGVTLSTPNFLVTPFAVGQPGIDSDLEALLARGAIGANGEPSTGAVGLITTAGAANPIVTSPGTGTGGIGGTGGTGGVGGIGTGRSGSPGGMGGIGGMGM